VGSKYVFGYEALINRKKKAFDLALDFPIIGETIVSLSLNPKEVSKQIGKTELVEVLREKIGERSDREEVLKTIKEFFVFASDFIQYRAASTYPRHFSALSDNGHFLLFRETIHYKFMIDNFSENPTFFERTVFKIFQKNASLTDPIMTLFLVPQSCDH